MGARHIRSASFYFHAGVELRRQEVMDQRREKGAVEAAASDVTTRTCGVLEAALRRRGCYLANPR